MYNIFLLYGKCTGSVNISPLIWGVLAQPYVCTEHSNFADEFDPSGADSDCVVCI